jgi:hypothetical protein
MDQVMPALSLDLENRLERQPFVFTANHEKGEGKLFVDGVLTDMERHIQV